MRVSDVLDRAADLIEPEGAWCQGADARDAHGCDVDYDSPRAKCFCIVGAINRVSGLPINVRAADHWSWETRRAFRLAAGEMPMPFNDADGRTKAAVVTKLREAAAIAREQGK